MKRRKELQYLDEEIKRAHRHIGILTSEDKDNRLNRREEQYYEACPHCATFYSDSDCPNCGYTPDCLEDDYS